MHARAMAAGGGPAWPAAWKLDSGQQVLFRDLVTVGRFAEGWHFEGKCFCGLDFASHNEVAGDKSTNSKRAFVCKRCKCFFIRNLEVPDGSLPSINYDEFTAVYITIEDEKFTQFEYLVLQKTLALKMALDENPAALSDSSAKQHAFTGRVVSTKVEQIIKTEQKWITTDHDLTVLLAHFKTFNRAMTSNSCEAFTIPGTTKHIELTYWYREAIDKNYVTVYSPGSIGLSKVYLISVKTISKTMYNTTAALTKLGLLISFITAMAAIYFEPAKIEEIKYFDAYENTTTSFDITSNLTITSEAFTAGLYAVFNTKFPDSVMLLFDHSRGDSPASQTLMPFNNENIDSCVDTAFRGVTALESSVSVTVSGATTTYTDSISAIASAIKKDYNVATLVPGGGAHPYLQIQSATPQSWTGVNMYRTTDSSALKAHIAGLVEKRVQESWHKGGAALKKDGIAYIAYRADNSDPPALTRFEKSAEVYVHPNFPEIAADICINAPNVVSWDKLKSGMNIVTDHVFWADFEAKLFTPVPFWKEWAATVGPDKDLQLTGTDVLPADMVYVPAWLALDILLKTNGLKFVPTNSANPDATYSVYDIWSLIATPKSSETVVSALARAVQALTSTAVQAADLTQQIGTFTFMRLGEGISLLADDIAKVSAELASTDGTSIDEVTVTDMVKMLAGVAAAHFIAVPAVVVGGAAAAHRYSGSSTFTWTPADATKPIETIMHGGKFTIDESLYAGTEQGAPDSGMHYVLSSFMEQIRLLTGQTLNNEIALPRSILTANNKGFQEVILKMLAGHEISQVGDDALSFSRTLTGAGLSNIYIHNVYTDSTLFQQTSPGKYINIGRYDRESSTLTVSTGNVNEVQHDDSTMTPFKPAEIDARTALGDLFPVEPGTISITEAGLPPFTLPRVNATEIFATADGFDFSTIGETITTAHSTIDTNGANGAEHPPINSVMTLGNVSRLSELYSNFYSALAYVPDRTIFENNTLASMAYATCMQNATNAWNSLFQTYTAGVVHTVARLQCNVWSNVNMQMLHLETDTSSQIWPALQYVVDHLVENKADFGIPTDGALIDLSTIIYWLDSATPPDSDTLFGENAKIWFRFGTKVKSLSLNGQPNSVRWTTTQPYDVSAQITALNIYCNARLNGITESIKQNMQMWGVTLSFPSPTFYPSPQPISLKVSPTLVSPYPTVATLPSVRLYQAFPWISSSVICCLFYMFWAGVMRPKGEVVIGDKTEFKDMLPRGIQPMILRHTHAVDSPVPAEWINLKDANDTFIGDRIQFTQQAA